MAHVTFPSLETPNLRYIIDKRYYLSRFNEPQGAIAAAQWYDTMGDGETQHTDRMMVGDSMLADFCFSLLSHLRAHPEDTSAVADHIRLPEVYRPQIEFFASLKYDENKTRYFNRQECKVSTADSKRHDKRWEIVPSWCQGTLKNIFTLWLNGRREDTFTRICAMMKIRDICDIHISIEREFDVPGRTEGAVIALRCILESHELIWRSNRILDNYLTRLSNKAQEQEQAA